jgi:hypothetical protein
VRFLIVFTLGLLLATPLQAARSIIVEAEGSACASKGNVSQKQEDDALNSALKTAHATAAEHVVNLAGLKGTAKGSELAALYEQGTIRGLQEIKKEKYRDSSGHKCARLHIRAEVAPDEKNAELLQRLTLGVDGSPLDVQVWPERQIYNQGESIFFFLKGNKPFFANIVYTDAAENIVQILPNEYQKEASFAADKAYKLPKEEEFIIKVSPPAFGSERITVYAATVPLHELSAVVPTGVVNESAGTNSGQKKSDKHNRIVEYVEVTSTLTTRQGN